MARQLYEFAPTIPAGTLTTAPVTLPMVMPTRIVRKIEVRVPPGPSGVMGFQIGAAGQAIIPANAGAFIVTDDERITWELEEQIESGAWQLIGYNTGDFPHTVYVRFLVDLPSDVAGASTPAPTVIPSDQIAPMTADDLAALTNTPPGTVIDTTGTPAASLPLDETSPLLNAPPISSDVPGGYANLRRGTQ